MEKQEIAFHQRENTPKNLTRDQLFDAITWSVCAGTYHNHLNCDFWGLSSILNEPNLNFLNSLIFQQVKLIMREKVIIPETGAGWFEVYSETYNTEHRFYWLGDARRINTRFGEHYLREMPK